MLYWLTPLIVWKLNMLRMLLGLILTLIISVSYAEQAPQKPLRPEQAFAFTSFLTPNNQLIMEWDIAPGYYLYRDKLRLTPMPNSRGKIGKIVLPQGQEKRDEMHGIYQAYTGRLQIPVTLINPKAGPIGFGVGYQGCSTGGFCYSPINKILTVELAPGRLPTQPAQPAFSDQDYATQVLSKNNLLLIILSFLGMGLLLAFTPCVLPMIPILSGIIIGHGKELSTAKAFLLSLAYVMGMALTYAVAGIMVAFLGSSIQAAFQKPWVIALFSGFFVLLAFSLFGYYELEMPSRWQQRIAGLSNRQKGGTYLGVFFMGVLSSLIVSPCVSAPLVGVLAYIAQTGNMVIGGIALLALGLGMGIPLLLIGTSAGKLLPKSGPWMDGVKKFFGFLMLSFAIWILSRVIPGPLALFLWAVLLIFSAIFMGAFAAANNTLEKISKGLGLIFLVYGNILIIGAALGNSDPFRPWEKWNIISDRLAPVEKLPFTVIKNSAELDQQLNAAKTQAKPVMLDFYADWCEPCVLMDHYLFSRLDVHRALAKFILLRVDVTKNTDFDQAILKRFDVIAPPTVIFFDTQGKELKNQRIIGEVNAKEFFSKIAKVKES